MDCSRCGLFIGGERARLVHDDPTLLRVTAEVPVTDTQRLLNQGQREAAARALEAAKELPPPVPPSVAFLTNPTGLSDARLKELADIGTPDAYAQLQLVADDLVASLAEQRTRDGRNVAVIALRKRLVFVQHLIGAARRARKALTRLPVTHPTLRASPVPILYKADQAAGLWSRPAARSSLLVLANRAGFKIR
jgi:hypothetical protein